MIGLDTNVLARFLIQDDPEQGEAAAVLIASLTEATPGFICREVLVELVWVLERAYRLPRSAVAQAVEGLLEAQEIIVEGADRAAIAIDRYRKGGPGFADQMISLAGNFAGCSETVTFDRKAAGQPGMRILGPTPDH